MHKKYKTKYDSLKAVVDTLHKEHPELTAASMRKMLDHGNGDSSLPAVATLSSWMAPRPKKRNNASKGVPNVPTPTLEQATESVIYAFEQAKLVDGLKQEVWELSNKLVATKEELKRFQDHVNNKDDQERRYRLAIQQGEFRSLEE